MVLRVACIAAGMALFAAAAQAAELSVRVTGVKSDAGEVGCALYRSADGFPTDARRATQQWYPARSAGVTCRFSNLPAGVYAIAVSHDLNGNRTTDTNFFGIPTEDWGVTNNVRPSLRAPRFEEARVDVADGVPVSVTIQVAR